MGWAAHPFITDETGTQGAGNWQLELAAQRDRHGAIAGTGAGPVQLRQRSTLLSPVLTYGLLDTVDIALGANHLRSRITENGTVVENASGAADSTLELKWRFYERGAFSFALKPALSVPTGDESRGLGTGRASWAINLIGAYDSKPWTAFGNLAYARPRFSLPQHDADSRHRLWRVSAGATRTVFSGLKLAGEIGTRTGEARNDPFRSGGHARFAMLGAIYSPSDKIDLDIGLRKGISAAETDEALLVGATVRW